MECVAILSPGDMGHAVAAHLRDRGLRVVSDLQGRSALTRERAARSGIEDPGGLDAVVSISDLVLAILPPSSAEALATRVAGAIERTGARPVYADCNAIAPATSRRLAAILEAAGSEFVDAGLIGAPPGRGVATRLYASGARAAALSGLSRGADDEGLRVHLLGDVIGRASALKMSYAALTKGTMTLHAAVLVAAHQLDVFDELASELESSQPQAWARMGILPFLPADAERWVGEMEEIAITFRDAGLVDDFHRGAAAIFRLMAATPYAAETRESVDRERTLEETIRMLGAHLTPRD